MGEHFEPQEEFAEFLNPRLVSRLRSFPKIFTVMVLIISTFTVCGWFLNLPFKMSLYTSVMLMLSAFTLLVQYSDDRPFIRNKNGRKIKVSVAAIMIIFVASINLIYEFVELDPSFFLTQESFRMAPITSIGFILIGLSLLLYEIKQRGLPAVSHLIAFPLGAIAVLPLIAHLYGAKFVTGIGAFSGMAPQTAICFLLLSGTILIGRLDNSAALLLASNGPGGSLVKRIFPSVFLIPLILGLLNLSGERAGFFSEELGSALVATASIGGFFAFAWLQGIVLQRFETKRRIIQRKHDYLDLQNQMRDQFVSMMSHDLRTPLSAASAYAQMTLRLCPNQETACSFIKKVIESLGRADQMIKDLLDINRIRAGHPFPISVSNCDLSMIIQTTIQELERIYGRSFKVIGLCELIGNWDAQAIRRAIENLCNNAIKYGLSDSIIKICIEVLPTKRVRIAVHNRGKPIAEDEQQKLFKPFQRVSTADHKSKKGWGIGLALVRAIAESHGGSVYVKSSQDYGTEFTLELSGT